MVINGDLMVNNVDLMVINGDLMVVNDGEWWLIIYLVGGWPTPLKNDGVRQLGWWHSQYMGK